MSSRIAIIDLGTNTFHLLVADVHTQGYSLVYREREAVKLGMRGINQELITEDAIQRALKTISKFKRTIDELSVKEIYACGTSAIRNARNQSAFLDRVLKETGVHVHVISGEEEARLIYLGVRTAVALGQQPSLIMDIGGGSVEFIIGNSHEIFWKQSFEIGAQRLLEKFQKHDPILPTEVVAMNQFFQESLDPLLQSLQKYKPETLVGSSGTFDTLSDIFSIRQGIPRNSEAAEVPLTFEGFEEIFSELLVRDRNARMLIPGMIEMRVDMIVVACCLIEFLIRRHPFSNLRVSSYALKEGILVDLIDRTR